MVNGLIRWSLNNRPVVLALATILLIGGSYVATTVPVDILPDLSSTALNMVVVPSLYARYGKGRA